MHYKHAGDTFRWMKQHENAVLFYDKAIKLDGQDASFYRARARAHRALGNDAAAARDERRAEQLDP